MECPDTCMVITSKSVKTKIIHLHLEVIDSPSVDIFYFVQCTIQCTCSIQYINHYSVDSSGRFYLQVTGRWVFLRVYIKSAS